VVRARGHGAEKYPNIRVFISPSRSRNAPGCPIARSFEGDVFLEGGKFEAESGISDQKHSLFPCKCLMARGRVFDGTGWRAENGDTRGSFSRSPQGDRRQSRPLSGRRPVGAFTSSILARVFASKSVPHGASEERAENSLKRIRQGELRRCPLVMWRLRFGLTRYG